MTGGPFLPLKYMSPAPSGLWTCTVNPSMNRTPCFAYVCTVWAEPWTPPKSEVTDCIHVSVCGDC